MPYTADAKPLLHDRLWGTSQEVSSWDVLSPRVLTVERLCGEAIRGAPPAKLAYPGMRSAILPHTNNERHRRSVSPDAPRSSRHRTYEAQFMAKGSSQWRGD